MSTYASNDDIQARVSFTIASSSKPSTSQIASMRRDAKALIVARLGSAVVDQNNRLLVLETNLVLRLIEQYYAIGRGETLKEVAITDDDYVFYQLDDFISEDTYGGGHYSVKVP